MIYSNRNRLRHFGFSIMELLVVLGIIGILLSILLSGIHQVRAAADRLVCQNHFKEIGLALQNFHGTFGRLPDGPPTVTLIADLLKDPDKLVSWRVALLPQMGEESLWFVTKNAMASHPNPNYNPPHIGVGMVLKSYTCPSDSRIHQPLLNRDNYLCGYSSYLGVRGSGPALASSFYQGLNSFSGETTGGNWGPGVMGDAIGIRFADVIDGLSHTLMVGERPPPANLLAGQWYSRAIPPTPKFEVGIFYGPDEYLYVMDNSRFFHNLEEGCQGAGRFGPGRLENTCDRFHFWSFHSGGGNFLFADGSVRYFAYSARDFLPALATRAGGEIVEIP